LIFIVAIKSIESEIIDAAMLDGVNPLQCFWYIKLPIIKSSLLICGILTIYNSFRCFREAYLIGGAHPNEQLYSIQHFLQNNFMNMNYARLEAASILVVLFVGAFVLIGMYLAKKRNNR
jgi:multiple sugar transport system permease protein